MKREKDTNYLQMIGSIYKEKEEESINKLKIHKRNQQDK